MGTNSSNNKTNKPHLFCPHIMIRLSRFRPSAVKKICREVMQQHLKDVPYNNDTAREASVDICEGIKNRVKAECNIPRYKIVCQVTLGEMKDQGVRVTSRCLWDPDTDNYSSAYFTNETYWGCAIVFGIYTE